MRKLLVVLGLMALVGASCQTREEPPSGGASPTGGMKETKAVTVGVDIPRNPSLPMYSLAYFPDDVVVHAGTTVEFRANFSGEPHTVSFGTLIDACLKAAQAQGRESEGPPPPECQKVPFVFPFEFKGPPEQAPLNQSAAQPCYLDTGEPPVAPMDKGGAPACDKKEVTPFTGQQAFHNSGILFEDDVWKLDIAQDAAAGTYQYMCLFHGPEMTGKITVVDKSQKAQTPEEVAAAGKSKADSIEGQIKPLVEKATEGLKTGEVVAGVMPGHEGENGPPGLAAEATVFRPAELSAKTGDTVTWKLSGFHSISFNAPEDARPVIMKEADGKVVTNAKALRPENSPPIPPPPPGESQGPPPPVNINGGTWDGSGFKSSGAFEGSYKLRFSKAGTYKYECLIHPDMEGTITVT